MNEMEDNKKEEGHISYGSNSGEDEKEKAGIVMS
jgi:hypothetical protein